MSGPREIPDELQRTLLALSGICHGGALVTFCMTEKSDARVATLPPSSLNGDVTAMAAYAVTQAAHGLRAAVEMARIGKVPFDFVQKTIHEVMGQQLESVSIYGHAEQKPKPAPPPGSN